MTLFIPVLILVPFLLLTYRVKHRVAFWVLVFLPPLLLAPVIVLPIRGPQSLGALLPLYIFLPASVVMLLVRSVQLLRKKADTNLRVKFIRPSLVVLMFIVASVYHKASANQANAYAVALASQLQAQCDTNGHCVSSIDGWRTNTVFLSDKPCYSSSIRRLRISYPVQYTPAEDGKSFTVTLVHGFNMELDVKGGVGKSLKAVYSDEGGSKEIPVSNR